MVASSKRMGNLSSTFKKAGSAYSISAPPVHGQKQAANIVKPMQTRINGRNMLMALKIRKDTKNEKATIILT